MKIMKVIIMKNNNNAMKVMKQRDEMYNSLTHPKFHYCPDVNFFLNNYIFLSFFEFFKFTLLCLNGPIEKLVLTRL